MDDHNATNYTADGFEHYPLLIACFLYLSLVYLVGFVGNLCVVLNFVRNKRFHRSSQMQYAFAISLADLSFLIHYLLSILQELDPNITYFAIFSMPCKLITFGMFLSSFLVAWFIVSLTIERFLTMVYPLRWRLSYKRARCALALVTLLGTLVNIVMLFVVDVKNSDGEQTQCDLQTDEKTARLINSSNVAITLALPILLLCILNFLLVRKIRLAGQRMTSRGSNNKLEDSPHGDCQAPAQLDTSLTTIEPSKRNGTAAHSPDHLRVLSRSFRRQSCNPCTHRERRLTTELVTVNLLYVALNLPMYVCRLMDDFTMVSSTYSEMFGIVYIISNLMFCTHYALNFVFYWVLRINIHYFRNLHYV